MLTQEELSYLRDEMNQRLKSFRENSNQTISHILLMWSGTLVLFGATSNFSQDMLNMIIALIAVIILFISNIILHLAVRKDFRSIETICRLSSYIIVFYERKFAADKKDGHIFWEIANIEIDAIRDKEAGKNLANKDMMIKEFTIMAIISTILILLCSVFIFLMTSFKEQDIGRLAMLSICLVAFCFSIYMICKIFKNLYSSRHLYGTEKRKWLHYYLDYAINNGYYSETDVLERFGKDFLNTMCYRMPIKKANDEKP
jgi:membrane protein YdbS with pleckstrin-like domain